ncbi:hypothetical protein B0H14DRAFT_3479266 [Mycena olivaceomarginata]|nr:hypothetical protein B0H14DRAFT_3479266 [Mycena olivaceomarginata]
MPKEVTLSTHAAHNASRPVQQPRKRSAATQATRALQAEHRNEQALALEADLEKHYAQQEELIKTLVLRYGRTEEYIRKVVCNGAKYGNRCGVNTKNAIMHEYCNRARDEGGPSNMRDVQGNMTANEYQKIKDSFTEEELTCLKDQLAEHREVKQHGPRATNKACQQDVVQTCNRVGEVASHSTSATCTRSHIFRPSFVTSTSALVSAGSRSSPRGNVDDPTVPNIVDSDNMREFFQRTFKMSIYDLLRKMEQWLCTRDRDEEDENTLDAVRSQISEMANKNLRKIKNNKKLEMEWTNYKIRIIPADNARRIRDLMRMEKIQLVALTRSQREKVAEEIEEMRATGTLPRRKGRSDKGGTHGPRAKNSGVADGVGDEEAGASAPTASASTGASTTVPGVSAPISSAGTSIPSGAAPGIFAPISPDGASATASRVSAPIPSPPAQLTAMAGIAPLPLVSAAVPGVSAPVSAGPQFPVTAGITSSPLVAVSAAGASAAAATPGVSAPVSSAGEQITAMAGIAPSPLVAVSAAGAPAVASPVNFGAGAQATSADGLIPTSQLALGSNFHYDFDFNFRPYLDNPSFNPSFAYQLDPNADTLRLNTSNRENEDWGFGSDGANGAIGPRFDTGQVSALNAGLCPNSHLGSSTSLAPPSSSFRGDGYIFPTAFSTSNANAATGPAGYSTSVFSVTGGNVEKPPRRPRKKKDGAAGADADGDAQPKPKKRKRAAANVTAA